MRDGARGCARVRGDRAHHAADGRAGHPAHPHHRRGGRVARAKALGLDALNISLDTVDPQVYRTMTRGGDVRDVLSTIDEALGCGLKVKINAVPVRGYNDEGLADLAAMARTRLSWRILNGVFLYFGLCLSMSTNLLRSPVSFIKPYLMQNLYIL